jgi:hypothetical protein
VPIGRWVVSRLRGRTPRGGEECGTPRAASGTGHERTVPLRTPAGVAGARRPRGPRLRRPCQPGTVLREGRKRGPRGRSLKRVACPVRRRLRLSEPFPAGLRPPSAWHGDWHDAVLVVSHPPGDSPSRLPLWVKLARRRDVEAFGDLHGTLYRWRNYRNVIMFRHGFVVPPAAPGKHRGPADRGESPLPRPAGRCRFSPEALLPHSAVSEASGRLRPAASSGSSVFRLFLKTVTFVSIEYNLYLAL